MAKFYYQKSGSKEPLNVYNDTNAMYQDEIWKTSSGSGPEGENGGMNTRTSDQVKLEPSMFHIRRKSKSHLDLSTQ